MGRDDVILQALPLFNTFALNQGINMLAMTGGTMCLLERFSVEEVTRVCRERACPSSRAVPAFVSDTASVGGEEGVGEIRVRGGGVMTRYVGTDEPVPVRDGWLHTGDLGRFRGDHLVIVDRIEDLNLRGGQNIHPGDVERALHGPPDILEIPVVGTPHPDLEEAPVAAVVLRPGAGGTTGEALLDWLRGRIAHYKVPVRIDVLNELPKGPTGKILKPALRRMLRSRDGRDEPALPPGE